ncbi:MAG TPA: hypothetical protein DCL77_03580 [Prolixibacteraceae bacterium]|jgi:hypothetical protein|nr:hypothetical protein [Prolixibacteraceae bacterium]
MNSQKIITGINVTEQMTKARDILNKQVLPKEALFQDRKRKGQLSKELLNALNANALLNNHRGM